MSGDNPTESAGHEYRNGEPRNANKELPPIRPFRYLKGGIRRLQREQAQRDKNRQYSNTAEGHFAALLDRADLCWRRIGPVSSNAIIAWFTIAVAITTILQWNAMTAQNKHIERQIGQTDDTLKQMQLEQRAWVSVTRPRFAMLEADKSIVFQMFLTNTGPTPAFISKLFIYTDVISKTADHAILEATFWEQFAADKSAKQVVVPPNASLDIPYTGQQVRVDEVAGIKSGELIFVAIFEIVYTDYTNATRQTHCHFTSERGVDGDSPQIVYFPEYNYMR